MAKISDCKTPQKMWESVSSCLVHFVEKIFFTLGVVVARNPWKIIILTWCFVLFSGVGLIYFHSERNPIKLWVPPESDFYTDTTWYIDKMGHGFRKEKLLITAQNVLDTRVLSVINNITHHVNSLKVHHESEPYTLQDLCFKVPVINSFGGGLNTQSNNNTTASESKINENKFTDSTLWLVNFNYDFYCDFLKSFQYVCLQENIVDLWKGDHDLLKNLTMHDIVRNVNNMKVNPVTGHSMNYSTLLGGVIHDDTGDIVMARSVLLTWYTYVNMTAVDHNEVGNLVGTEEWVTVPVALWENEFLKYMATLKDEYPAIDFYYEAGRSFGDVSGDAMLHEMDKLFIGILLMFLYIQFVMSRFNWLEIRLTLGSVGLLCVGMAYITAVSWCSLIGIPFGPVHSSLPFLLMGLGIDDMFVMKACWEQLSPSEREKSLPIKMGLMLKHAGVSIIITSFTDIVALLIGAITILPSLKSFCIYAAVGVFFIFCFSTTFYVAVFTLDIRRIEANRNGLLFCYKHKKPVKTSNSETVFKKIFTEFYKKIVFTKPVKVIIILFTLGVTGLSIEAMLRLEQRFDPTWFIPEGTYFREFLDKHDVLYPDEGNAAMVFLGEMDYNYEVNNLLDMVHKLKAEPYVNDVNDWVESFYGYLIANFDIDLRNTTLSTDQFNLYLSKFLFSPIGGGFQAGFKFSEPIECGHPVSSIMASSFSFKFSRFRGPDEYIPAMNTVKAIVKSANISTGDGYRSVWSKVFANWVTDEVISIEVERNIELALLCVMVCTVILITNLQMCMWIFICVLLTIINVLGFMQRWGMTVDIVCCIGLELAIGLCVDYAAHVGHTFLTISEGSRQDRALQTVTSIGSAVLLGGGSTFLSLSLLSTSKAYTFNAFFKIFCLVIVFGLFNGLLFLPTVLSLVGPSSYTKKPIKSAEAVELNGKSELKEIQKQDDLEYTEVPS